MKYLFGHFRSALFPIVVLTVLCVCLSGVCQKTYGQIPIEVDRELTVDFFLEILNRNVGTIEQRNQALLKRVRTRPLKFILIEDDEQRLTDAGASTLLLDTIRKESAKLEKTAFGYDYLGRKYLALGRKHRALEEQFSRAARESRMQKNEEEAIKNEEEARKNNEQAILNLDRAVSYFKQASEIEPDNLVPVSNIGVAYDVARKYDEALMYFSRVIEREPLPSRYINRGIIYEKKGLSIPTSNMPERKAAFDKAIADYTSALAIDPTNTTALKQRADVYKFWNRKEEEAADRKRLDDIRNGRVSPQ